MRIEVDGLQTNYQSIGRKENALLLLHGWGNSWEAWSPLIPHLSQKYRLIIPDLPGFGQSESPSAGWSTNRYARWLQKFLAQIEVNELTGVLGHSFGGKIAAFGWWGESSALPPAKQGYFLFDPSGIVNELPWSRRAVRAAVQTLPRSIKRGSLAKLRRTLYTRLLGETDYFSATSFQEQTLNIILSEDIRSNFVKKDWPLHFCWGEKDTETPLWMAYEFNQISSNSDVFVVPGAGHFPHHEETSLVLRWLESNGL